MKLFNLENRKCRHCGKHFESRPEYAYKIEYNKDRYWYFCSWRCIQAYRRAG